MQERFVKQAVSIHPEAVFIKPWNKKSARKISIKIIASLLNNTKPHSTSSHVQTWYLALNHAILERLQTIAKSGIFPVMKNFNWPMTNEHPCTACANRRTVTASYYGITDRNHPNYITISADTMILTSLQSTTGHRCILKIINKSN